MNRKTYLALVARVADGIAMVHIMFPDKVKLTFSEGDGYQQREMRLKEGAIGLQVLTFDKFIIVIQVRIKGSHP